jgi:antitoxin HicB
MIMNYDIVVRPIPEDQGGGFMGFVPDLQGCMSDGDTPEEAFANTVQAMSEWLDLHRRKGRRIPEPGEAIRRAREERDALRDAIHVLSGDLSNRLDDVEVKVAELQKVLDRLASLSPTEPTYAMADLTAHRHQLEVCH